MAASEKTGRFVLWFISIPFIVAGGFMSWLGLRPVVEARAMRAWVEVPATIEQAGLKEHRSDDGTTYEATARYTYTFQGIGYQGDRVSLHGGGDNVGGFQRRAHAELKRHRQEGRPFSCWVDPEQPASSILYPEPRWGMVALMTLLGLVFGGVGIGLGVRAATLTLRARKAERARKERPGEPWSWNPAWHSNLVPSARRSRFRVALVVAVFWTLVSLPATVLTFEEVMGDGNTLAALGFLFPAVAAAFYGWAFYEVQRKRKFGDSFFMMKPFPGVLGGPVSGVVQVPVHLRAADGFNLELSCIERNVVGSGKNRQVQERVLWQDTAVMQTELLERDITRTAIPVFFHAPFDQPPSDSKPRQEGIRWRLLVGADVPGSDYRERFEIPVFKTGASSPEYRPDLSAVAPYRRVATRAECFARAGFVLEERTGGGLRIVSPPARHKGVAAGFTAFFLVWTAAVYAAFHFGAPLFMVVVFGLVDLAIAYGVWCMWFKDAELRVESGMLTLRSGFLGSGTTRVIRAGEIGELYLKQGMQSGSRVFFDIMARLKNGRKKCLLRWVGHRRLTEEIMEEIRATLGWRARQAD